VTCDTSNSSNCDDLECPWSSLPYRNPFRIYGASRGPSASAELLVAITFRCSQVPGQKVFGQRSEGDMTIVIVVVEEETCTDEAPGRDASGLTD